MRKLLPKSPLITIIVAAKNCAKTIQRCIDSFREQTYENKELIIIDGGSSDETVKLLTANTRDINYWESKPDRGIAHAWNKALRHATGDWILFIGSDDYLAHPKVLEKFGEKIANHQTSTGRIVYASIKRFFPHGDYLDTQGVDWCWARTVFFSKKMTIPHPACFHHCSIFEEFGGFDETFSIAADYEFLLRVLKNEEALFFPDYIVTHMTFGGISARPTTLLIMQKEVDRALRKHGIKPTGYKRIGNIIIYNFVDLLAKSGGDPVAARILDTIRIILRKPPLWTRK